MIFGRITNDPESEFSINNIYLDRPDIKNLLRL